MENICDFNKCTGCYVCQNICPRQAITMIDMGINGIHPKINEDLCISCKICKNHCPCNLSIEGIVNYPLKAYAYSSNISICKNSSSGGASYTLYQDFIKKGGIVYGVGDICNGEFLFKRIDNIDELNELQGSKYVHSYVGSCYKRVKEDLKDNKNVLFIGTPCQIMGLKIFLQNRSYEKLFVVDLICHGVPSQSTLFNSISVENKTIKKMSFRNGISYELAVWDNRDKKIYKEDFSNNGYLKEFMRGSIFRENCYECVYARQERLGDITIGDFWGLSNDSKIYQQKNNGISLIIVNNQKGKFLLNILKSYGIYEERPLKEAFDGNAQLNYPSKKNKEYYKIRKYEKKGLNYAYRKCRTLREILRDNEKLYSIYKVLKRGN